MHKKMFLPFLLTLIPALIAAAGGREENKGGPAANSVLLEKPRGKITVSCYDSMIYRNFLEQAARIFEERFPGTEVEVQTFSAMPDIRSSESGGGRTTLAVAANDPQDRAGYINRVNTALMSGEGADIYAMDILPQHRYVEKGQLENLAAYMERDPHWVKTDYRENILEAAKYRGGLWFIPMDYGFDYYAYDALLMPEPIRFGAGKSFTVQELVDLAKQRYDGSAKILNVPDYLPGPAGGMFNLLLDEHYPFLVDLENRRGNFQSGVFVNILKTAREYAGAGYIPQGAAGLADPEQMMLTARGQETDRYFFKLNSNFALINQFNRGSGRRMIIRSAGSINSIEDDDEIAGVRANAGGFVPFRFSQVYGIKAHSKNKGTAWEFLKFLLSEEMQSSAALLPQTLPINNRARAEKAELVFSGAVIGRMQELDENQREVLEKYKAAVETLSDQINRYVIEDTVINDMIALEAEYFFGGTKTAAESAAALQNKVNLYLNE
jgi:multiple sugar transport system substrate-binding protein